MILYKNDGSWQKLVAKWQSQCDEEEFDIFRDGTFGFLEKLIENPEPSADVLCSTGDAGPALICQVNTAAIKGYDSPVLRVRHIVLSPYYDLNNVQDVEYGKILVNMFYDVWELSDQEGPHKARHLKFHLKSPSDQVFFAAVAEGLKRATEFESVQMGGTWLYVTKA